MTKTDVIKAVEPDEPFRGDLHHLVRWLLDNTDVDSRNQCIEIGSMTGNSAAWWQKLYHQVWLIDPLNVYPPGAPGGYASKTFEWWHKHRAALTERLRDWTNVHWIQLPSEQAAQHLQGPVDLIYIDGNHSYNNVMADIKTWSLFVAGNGILAGHDYSERFPGVVQAVDEAYPERLILPGSNWLVDLRRGKETWWP